MRLTTLACVLGIVLSGPALAAEAPDDPGAAPLRPAILKTPPSEWAYLSVGPYYPVRALEANARGAALLACDLQSGGRLRKCRVLDETRGRFGFGEASIRMAKAGWLTAEPRIVNGAPVETELVRVLVRFEIDGKSKRGRRSR